jgi:hypothetical protein
MGGDLPLHTRLSLGQPTNVRRASENRTQPKAAEIPPLQDAGVSAPLAITQAEQMVTPRIALIASQEREYLVSLSIMEPYRSS